jgi:hypothetical protein
VSLVFTPTLVELQPLGFNSLENGLSGFAVVICFLSLHFLLLVLLFQFIQNVRKGLVLGQSDPGDGLQLGADFLDCCLLLLFGLQLFLLQVELSQNFVKCLSFNLFFDLLHSSLSFSENEDPFVFVIENRLGNISNKCSQNYFHNK